MSEVRAPARKRPKIPKVRTGCKTCKVRRVKCDETRPECKRCLAFGPGYCDGYEYGILRREQPEKKPILPKAQYQALIRKPEPQRDPRLEIFKDQHEYYCFRLYMEEVAPRLSFSNQSIWYHLLLQTTQNQPFIRHAVVTIGALCRLSSVLGTKDKSTLGIQRLPQLFPGCNEPSVTKQYYEFALQQYDKFLTAAKDQISVDVVLVDDHMRRTALIACLLVVCIENLQFRYTVALTHAQNGLRLMQEYIDTAPKRDYTYGTTSSPPYAIEDELVLQFKRLDLQTLSYYGARTPVDHGKVKCEGSSRMRSMPDAFTDIDEARLYLDIVMRRTYHFMAHALKNKLSYIAFHDTILGESDYAIKACYKNNPPGDISFGLPDHSDAIQVEQEMYASENRRWSQAFEPLFRTALHNMDSPDSLKAFLLKIHSLSLSVRLAGILASSELIYDTLMPQFRQIVSLSKTVLQNPHSNKLFAAGSFSFDIGIIYPLLAVSYACRDRGLRREAITLLESRSWREAQWGSSPSVHVSRFLVDIEEEGVEGEWIPEWARARLTGIEVNTGTGMARVKCVRGTGESAETKYSVWH